MPSSTSLSDLTSDCGCALSTVVVTRRCSTPLGTKLAAIERWPDYTVKLATNQLAAIERWPDYTVKPTGSNREVA